MKNKQVIHVFMEVLCVKKSIHVFHETDIPYPSHLAYNKYLYIKRKIFTSVQQTLMQIMVTHNKFCAERINQIEEDEMFLKCIIF